MLVRQHYTVTREKYVKTPTGAKRGRFIDVYGVREGENGPETRSIQIGRTEADGTTPVSREVSAMDDIQNATGQRPEFLDYQAPAFESEGTPIPGWPVQPPSIGIPGIGIPEEPIDIP